MKIDSEDEAFLTVVRYHRARALAVEGVEATVVKDSTQTAERVRPKHILNCELRCVCRG